MGSIISYAWNLLVQTGGAVLQSLAHNWLVLALAIVTAVLTKTYVNTEKLGQALLKWKTVSIYASVAVGAFTPFCACGTMAIIIGMLTTTLPWGPIMAFLTSSPLMSPDGFILIAGVIGLRFAIALTLASIAIGLSSGLITNIIERKTKFFKNQTRYMGKTATGGCACSTPAPATPCGCSAPEAANGDPFAAKDRTGDCGCSQAIHATGGIAEEGGSCQGCLAPTVRLHTRWQEFVDRYKLRELADGLIHLGLRQILLYFSLFVAVGYLINHFVPTSIVSVLFGAQSIAAVPLASLVGLPLYVTTESAIPLIQSMIESGASEGAMLAFIIAGSATSAWVIAGLSTFLKKRAIALYVLYILVGSIASGYLYDLVLALLG